MQKKLLIKNLKRQVSFHAIWFLLSPKLVIHLNGIHFDAVERAE